MVSSIEIKKDNNGKPKGEKITFGAKKGFTGTSIYDGYLDVDYANDWKDLGSRIALIQKMVDGDGTTSAILDAIKTPLLSAKYFIEADESVDQKIIDYADNFIFKYQQKGFQSFLVEMLTFIENGFCVFEKVPMIVGSVLYYNLDIRVQSSIEKWSIHGKPWKNGNPAGITQVINSMDDTGGQYTAEIPWNKILLFSYQRVGNNFEGKSILRRMNIHFKMKQMLYKISIIAAERFGVGVPYAKHKIGVNDAYITKLEEMLGNIKTNEQAYMILNDNIQEFGILTPDGNSEKSSIDSLIKHHDKKMYDSVLAGFLNLTSGEGGSNALSKDQSSFFLRSLQGIADYYCEIINSCIKEGVIFNFGEQKEYPVIACSDIGQTSLDEYTDAMSKAKEKGIVSWRLKDENKYREQAKMQPIEEDERNEIMQQEKESTKTEVIERKENEEKNFSEKKNLFFANIKNRERSFMRIIGDYENYLESEYTNFLKMFEETEKSINNKLKEEYSKVDTKRIDGIVVIDSTSKNNRIENSMIKFVDSEIKKLENKVIDGTIQKRIFEKTRQTAIKGLKESEKFFSGDVKVNESQFNSFIKGYISNTMAVLFNDSRRVKENIVLNFGSQVSVDLAVKQAGKQVFNRNILKLSTITHARGAFNAIQYNENVKNGFVFYKIVAPKKRISGLSPNGMIANCLWLILSAAEITRRANEETDGKNTDAISGLNLHHNAFVYYYPISSENLEEEKAIAREQRAELKLQLEK